MIQSKDEKKLSTQFVFFLLAQMQDLIFKHFQRGQAQPHVYIRDLQHIKIPLPSPVVQQTIVSEIEAIEREEDADKKAIQAAEKRIADYVNESFGKYSRAPVERYLLPVSDSSVKIPKDQFQSTGAIPVVSQESNSVISGYTNGVQPITDLPLIVFGDHSVSFKYVDFPFVRGADGVQLLKPDPTFYVAKAFFYFVRQAPIENADKYERHFKYLKKAQIPLPSIAEQEAIVAAIEKEEAIISKAQERLKGAAARKAEVLKKHL